MLGLSIPTADWLRIVVVENFLWLLDLDNLVLVSASGSGNAGQWIFALRRSNIFTSYHDLSCQGFLWQMLQLDSFVGGSLHLLKNTCTILHELFIQKTALFAISCIHMQLTASLDICRLRTNFGFCLEDLEDAFTHGIVT